MSLRPVVLSGLAGLSAVLTISWPSAALGSIRLAHGFTPLTTILILGLAATRSARTMRYRWSIVAGLAGSLAGDILLMLPPDHFLAGLLCFVVTHACYLFAFTSDSRFAVKPLPFVAWGGIGLLAVASLWPAIPPALRPPVVLYAGLLLVTASQAASRALCLRTSAAMAASLGSTLFVVSDTLLALNRFGHAIPLSRALVLGTYFTAQWLIAWSISQRARPRVEVAPGEDGQWRLLALLS